MRWAQPPGAPSEATSSVTAAGWLAERLWSRFDPVLLILSPPRCGSTAVARSFCQNPRFGCYLHEPCDRVYHHGGGLGGVEQALAEPLGVHRLGGTAAEGARGVVVKEMTFQPGPLLPELLAAATLPVVVTVRDPRLAVWSRMRQREKGGQPPSFPPAESGWRDLKAALETARDRRVPYLVVDVTRLRSQPGRLLPALCQRLGLPFTPQMLSWPSLGEVPLGQLGAEQRHWYARVLASSGFERATEPTPELDAFPATDGMRAHVSECVRIYRETLTDLQVLA